MFRRAAATSKSAASAKSILVMIATSELFEYRWILQRLVFAFGGREQDEAELFAEVIAGRADEITDVFNKKEIEVVELPSFQCSLDHLGVEMADGSGSDLADVRGGALEAGGVVFSREISDQCGDVEVAGEAAEELFKEGGLARAGA